MKPLELRFDVEVLLAERCTLQPIYFMRSGGHCDDADSGRQRTTRADEVPLAAQPGRQPARAANMPGLRHVAFAVEDIDAVVAGLRARGAELVGWSVTRIATGSAMFAVRKECPSLRRFSNCFHRACVLALVL